MQCSISPSLTFVLPHLVKPRIVIQQMSPSRWWYGAIVTPAEQMYHQNATVSIGVLYHWEKLNLESWENHVQLYHHFDCNCLASHRPCSYNCPIALREENRFEGIPENLAGHHGLYLERLHEDVPSYPEHIHVAYLWHLKFGCQAAVRGSWEHGFLCNE